jgi:hypothetical protein
VQETLLKAVLQAGLTVGVLLKQVAPWLDQEASCPAWQVGKPLMQAATELP